MQMELRKDEALYEAMLARDEPVELPPPRRTLPWSLIGVYQNEARFKRGEIFDERKAVTDYMNYLRAEKLAVIPKTEELEELPGARVSEIREAMGIRAVPERVRGFSGVMGREERIRTPPVFLRQAVKMAKVTLDWLPKLDNQMLSLSGGNPFSMSDEWYNIKGQTSKTRLGVGWYKRQGLFMLTKIEFNKYKEKGHDSIFDPLDNTLAYINMLKAKGRR